MPPQDSGLKAQSAGFNFVWIASGGQSRGFEAPVVDQLSKDTLRADISTPIHSQKGNQDACRACSRRWDRGYLSRSPLQLGAAVSERQRLAMPACS